MLGHVHVNRPLKLPERRDYLRVHRPPRDRAAAVHFLDLAEVEIRENIRSMYENADETMLDAAEAALKHSQSLPNSSFIIPERSQHPGAKGTGRTPNQHGIKAFPGEKWEGKPHQPVKPEVVPS